MKSQRLTGIRILLSLCFLTVGQATAQESNISSADYLAPFAMLVGGEWHIDGFYQTLTWGVGKKSIISKGYFVDTAGKSKLVSEGMWYLLHRSAYGRIPRKRKSKEGWSLSICLLTSSIMKPNSRDRRWSTA